MSSAAFRASNIVTRTCLGGVRFRDPLSGANVSGGLQVSATRGGVTRSLAPSRSGTFALHSFPGFVPRTFWDGPGADPTEPVTFEIQVTDAARNFMSMRMQVELPAWPDPDHPSVVPACQTAAEGPAVPLFSAPARAVPAGVQALRGQLRLRSNDKPAPWVLLTVYRQQDPPATRVALGSALSDPQGSFVLLFPVPLPDAPQIPVQPQATSVVIEALFDGSETSDVPDYCRVRGQAAASLLQEIKANPANDVPLGTLTLAPGTPTVLFSVDYRAPLPGKYLYLKTP